MTALITGKFSIRTNSGAETRAARGVLGQIGYAMYPTFKYDKDLDSRGDCLIFDGFDFSRGALSQKCDLHFASLASYLEYHYDMPKRNEKRIAELKAELAKLEAQQ